jgi:ATP-dependent DNA helicase DinG
MRPSILECFPSCLSPREGQTNALRAIEQAFNQGKKFFVYEGPTGAGKSVVAKTVVNWMGTGFVTAPLNILVSQYANDPKVAPLAEVRGKGTYQCRAFTRAAYTPTCEQAEETAGSWHHSERCSDYIPARDKFWLSKQSVTNLHFLYYSPVMEGALWPRRVLVVDEAHRLEKALIDMGRRTIWPRTVAEVKAKLYEFPGAQDGDLLDRTSAERWLRYFEDALTRTLASVDSYEDRKKLQNLQEGINFTLQSGEWISWLTSNSRNERILNIAPMTAGRAAGKLFRCADHVLFTSATIGDAELFMQSLGVKKDESRVFRGSCDFPVENRPIYYRPKATMSRKSGNAGFESILQACCGVLESHSEDRGIIHCPSRELQRAFYSQLRSRFADRVLTHGEKTDRNAGVQRLRLSRNGVLCSTAMAEGIDLADDAARFCIFPKVPWPYMGDPYVKARMEKDPEWFSNETALLLVQGSGRVVRHAQDRGETYIFDKSFGYLLQNSDRFPEWWLEALRG